MIRQEAATKFHGERVILIEIVEKVKAKVDKVKVGMGAEEAEGVGEEQRRKTL